QTGSRYRPHSALRRPAPRAASAASTSRVRPRVDEAGHLRDDLADGARGRNVVQRNRNVEAILELGDHFEHLERIEAEIGHAIAGEGRLDGPPADVLQHVDPPYLDRDGGRLQHLAARKNSIL